MLTLEEVKVYLRVDGEEDDALILRLMDTSKELCEVILRKSLADMDPVPPLVIQAILFGAANLYEKRDGTHWFSKNEPGGLAETMRVMKLILAAHREESW